MTKTAGTKTAGRTNFDLAILFVHGIGKQRPSDTLIAGAVPLVQWLRQQSACQELRLTEAPVGGYGVRKVSTP